MIKKYLKICTFYILLFSFAIFPLSSKAQAVGIGNREPRGLLDVNDNIEGNASSGIVFPRTNDLSSIRNMQTMDSDIALGTVVFDANENCIRFYNGTSWSDCLLDNIDYPFKLTNSYSTQTRVKPGVSEETGFISYIYGKGTLINDQVYSPEIGSDVMSVNLQIDSTTLKPEGGTISYSTIGNDGLLVNLKDAFGLVSYSTAEILALGKTNSTRASFPDLSSTNRQHYFAFLESGKVELRICPSDFVYNGRFCTRTNTEWVTSDTIVPTRYTNTYKVTINEEMFYLKIAFY